MAKKLMVLCVLVLFLACANAFAGGSGNCILPIKTTTEHIGTGAAFGFNGVSSRLMDLYNYNKDEDDLKVEDLAQVYGAIPFGLSETRNIVWKIGAADYRLKFDNDGTNETITVDVDSGIYTGIGINNLFPLECAGEHPLSWGYDLQINGYINEVGSVTRNGNIADETGTLYGIDGQESLYLAYNYELEKIRTTFVPYLGVYHSWIVIGSFDDVTYTRNAAQVSHDIQGAFDALSFGLLLGLDVEIAKYVNLNVEGRFIGETAITTGATIKF